MKSAIKIVGLMVACIVAATQANAQTATGKLITGSKHDFKTTAYVGEGGTMKLAYNKCSTCHAAHKPKKNSPLWARDNPTNTGWTVWNGAAGRVLDGTNDGTYLSADEFVASGSGMCMSCHDGVTAIGNTSGGTPVTMASTFHGNWGRDLNDMHPVGKKVPFNTPGWVADLLTGNTASGSTVVVDVVGGNSFVGCTSCHSMHKNSAMSAMILRVGERCLSCHAK